MHTAPLSHRITPLLLTSALLLLFVAMSARADGTRLSADDDAANRSWQRSSLAHLKKMHDRYERGAGTAQTPAEIPAFDSDFDASGRIARVRYVLPPHEAANWVGPGRCPIREILTHLGEPLEPPPVSPARGPPTDWGELVRAHAERKAIQASPDELLVIDIHLL